MAIFVTRAAVSAMVAAALLGPVPVMAQTMSYSGLIISKDEKGVILRTASGDKRVRINPETKIQAISGALGGRRKSYSASDLIRGLSVEMVATPQGEELIAHEITFKASALKTAQQIHAGLVETEGRIATNAEGIAENADRIDNVGDLVAAGRVKVFFAVGSAAINAQAQHDLMAFADKAKATRGYRLAVVGRADPTGDAAANKRLSLRRARAVTDYLTESCGILPGRIVPTTALGESSVAQDPDAPRNNDEARRVTVTIMVSKSARKPG